MKKYVVLSFAFVTLSFCARSQGCISVRNIVGFGQFVMPQTGEEPIKWIVNVNSRYFESWKTYQGATRVYELPEKIATNHIFVADFSFTRMLENGWSISFDLPVTSAARTSVKEHDGNDPNHTFYTTHAFGLSDIRVAVYKWIWDVSKYHKGNIQLGLGLKLPTGDYRYQDYFHKKYDDESQTVLAPVNISTQLGDGGTGFTLEMNSFYTLNKSISLYANGFYLISPRDQNGVSNLFGGKPGVPGHPEVPGSVVIAAGGIYNSVPDAYTARLGANFTVNKFIFSAGARIEGAPVHDLVGASNGLRRSGYVISVEPGVNYNLKNSMLFAYVPIPFYKTTKQTVPDQEISRVTGVTDANVQSSGGFADYLIFVGVLFKVR